MLIKIGTESLRALTDVIGERIAPVMDIHVCA